MKIIHETQAREISPNQRIKFRVIKDSPEEVVMFKMPASQIGALHIVPYLNFKTEGDFAIAVIPDEKTEFRISCLPCGGFSFDIGGELISYTCIQGFPDIEMPYAIDLNDIKVGEVRRAKLSVKNVSGDAIKINSLRCYDTSVHIPAIKAPIEIIPNETREIPFEIQIKNPSNTKPYVVDVVYSTGYSEGLKQFAVNYNIVGYISDSDVKAEVIAVMHGSAVVAKSVALNRGIKAVIDIGHVAMPEIVKVLIRIDNNSNEELRLNAPLAFTGAFGELVSKPEAMVIPAFESEKVTVSFIPTIRDGVSVVPIAVMGADFSLDIIWGNPLN